MKKWRWIHRWFSLFIGPLLLLWSVSGILLNHRGTISSFTVSRSWLPKDYQFKNWNNASIRSSCNWSEDSVLVYGNIGIWLTDNGFNKFQPLMQGMPEGVDPVRTMKVVSSSYKAIYAATQSGIYYRLYADTSWKKLKLNNHDERVMDLVLRNDTLFAMDRSFIYLIDIMNDHNLIKTIELKKSTHDDDKTSLFRTLWVIHSGEIVGLVGKLLVDLLALLLVFLVLTGYVYFFFPKWIRRMRLRGKKINYQKSINSFSIRWHNKLGIWIGWFLIITIFTGIFLRPPLLITIAEARVGKIPFSLLDQHNKWHDKLRSLVFSEETNKWLLGTSEGIFSTDYTFIQRPEPLNNVPPISVMGINVFEYFGNGYFLLGSFNGLFIWHAENGVAQDFITGESLEKKSSVASPIGKYLISGLIKKNGEYWIFDYDKGLLGRTLQMPEEIRNTPIPLWNLALEFHTARIFEPFIGPFYLLIIPLTGIITLLILFSGIVIYLKRIRRNKANKSPL